MQGSHEEQPAYRASGTEVKPSRRSHSMHATVELTVLCFGASSVGSRPYHQHYAAS
jgi:hypothetical protein